MQGLPACGFHFWPHISDMDARCINLTETLEDTRISFVGVAQIHSYPLGGDRKLPLLLNFLIPAVLSHSTVFI